MNWLDAGILILLALGALRGLRRGIGVVFVGLAGFLVALAAAAYACPRLVDAADARYGLLARTGEFLERHVRLPVPTAAVRLAGTAPEDIQAALEGLPVSGWVRALLLEHGPEVAAAGGDTLVSVGDVVYHVLAGYLVAVGIFVGTFILARLVLDWLGGAISDFLGAIPVLGGISRLAGAALGAAERGLLAVVILGAASAFSPLAPFLDAPLAASRLAPLALEVFRRLLPLAPTLRMLLGS
ncbi:MAG: hypothetical protein RDU89_09370 [bacterium]|nr:hypothetical protein [bacterium]